MADNPFRTKSWTIYTHGKCTQPNTKEHIATRVVRPHLLAANITIYGHETLPKIWRQNETVVNHNMAEDTKLLKGQI